MAAEYRIRLSEEFFRDAGARCLSQTWFAWTRVVIVLVTLVLAVFVGVALYQNRILSAIGSAIVLGDLVILMILAPRFKRWQAHRNLRKFLHPNDEMGIRLSDEGVSFTGRNGETRAPWTVITKARRFSDGLLLFEGPKLCRWLPDSAADVRSIAEAERLVRANVSDYRDA
ncbi:MAG: YcxB family protein [Planctomycetaceae bacterium]|nr:YcxB family protein [Planctomycetaceae bacterium]